VKSLNDEIRELEEIQARERKPEKNLDLIKEQISTRLNLLSREIHNNRLLKQYMWTGY
jgi:hypothetical protein